MPELNEAEKQQLRNEGMQEAIDLVKSLGQMSKGQPLTPGFIVFQLTTLLKSKGA